MSPLNPVCLTLSWTVGRALWWKVVCSSSSNNNKVVFGSSSSSCCAAEQSKQVTLGVCCGSCAVLCSPVLCCAQLGQASSAQLSSGARGVFRSHHPCFVRVYVYVSECARPRAKRVQCNVNNDSLDSSSQPVLFEPQRPTEGSKVACEAQEQKGAAAALTAFFGR